MLPWRIHSSRPHILPTVSWRSKGGVLVFHLLEVAHSTRDWGELTADARVGPEGVVHHSTVFGIESTTFQSDRDSLPSFTVILHFCAISQIG